MSIKSELLSIKTIEEWNSKAEYFRVNNLVMDEEVLEYLNKVLGRADNEILDDGNFVRDFPNLDLNNSISN